MTELVITRGLPASGKTTFARQWVKEGDKRVRVNRDDLRLSQAGVNWGPEVDEQAVTIAQQAAVEALLRAGRSVIVDDTNLRLRNARAWADMAAAVGAEFTVVDIETDVDTCVMNDGYRALAGGRLVTETVIRDFAQRYRMPWPEVKPTPRKAEEAPEWYVPDETLPKAWLVDIDGTVAKMNGRDPHEYHRVGEDLPNDWVIRLVRMAQRAGDHIVFLSGRKESCRDQTEEWLVRNIGHWTIYCELHMRATEDNRADFIVKAELFDEHVRNRWNVQGVLDDRDQVVRMWRSMGLGCAQVDVGNF